MRAVRTSALAVFALIAASCSSEPGAAQQTGDEPLTASDEAAIFAAAGFTRVGDHWQACDLTDTPSYSPGSIEWTRDLNGDGLPEVLVMEGSAMCFGMTGASYAIVSKQGDDSWKLITGGIGLIETLESTGKDGWPDLQIGGPGFCFPVHRWNGTEYDVDRFQYEGKPCKPPY